MVVTFHGERLKGRYALFQTGSEKDWMIHRVRPLGCRDARAAAAGPCGLTDDEVAQAGKVLVDWSQNDDSKTTVCVYSLRAKERPTVSTPVEWDEVERALAEGDKELLTFDHAAALDRVEERGDPFAPVLTERQELPELGG